MAFGRDWRSRTGGLAAPLLFLTVAAYFGWSATRGDLGLKTYVQRERDLAAAKANLARAEAEVKVWEQQVRSLRSSRLDQDALDERARAMLNRADPADIVVPYGANNRLF